MKDKYGRNINYLRVSITDRCNLRCIYCMPEKGIVKKDHGDILRFEETIKIIKAAAELGINKIRFTGGEPLIIEGIDKLIYETAKISGIEEIALTTNGILLTDMIKDLKIAGLGRVNISLDTLNNDKYKKITRLGDISKIFSAIDECIRLGLEPLKINTVLIKGVNDDEISDFIKFAKNMPIEVRFIELMPIGEGIKLFESGKISVEEALSNYKELIPLKSQKNSVAQLYEIKGGKGKIGFITPISCKFCSNCNKLRLTSVGTIKPCLHSKDEINIKQYIGNYSMLKNTLESAILGKPLEHNLDNQNNSDSQKLMYQIGG